MKNKKIIYIALVLVLVFTLGIYYLFFNTYDVSGRITDLTTGEAVANTEVVIGNVVTITNNDGVFQLKGIRKYKSGEIKINVPTGYEELLPISLEEDTEDIKISPTLETMVIRINNASRNIQHDYLWDYMHPDDQLYWESKEKYSSTFKKVNSIYTELGYGNVNKSEIGKNIRKLDIWTHEITKKEYSNVMEVPIETKINENESKIELVYYQKVDGIWRYFTQSNKEDYQGIINAYEDLQDFYSG